MDLQCLNALHSGEIEIKIKRLQLCGRNELLPKFLLDLVVFRIINLKSILTF